jgi:hypothetical protein
MQQLLYYVWKCLEKDALASLRKASRKETIIACFVTQEGTELQFSGAGFRVSHHHV